MTAALNGVAPGWIPLNSASSGAALAGVLAAIVITISIQISTRASKETELSLKAAPPTLVVLMVAAYLYIVLDGIPTTSAEVIDAVASTSTGGTTVASQGSAYADIASRGFAISGSVLALGALMTLFIVAASVLDNRPRQDPHQVPGSTTGPQDWALAVFRVAVFTIMVVLLLGYMVGAQIDNSSTHCWWWLAHVVPCCAPALLVTGARNTGTVEGLENAARKLRRSPSVAVFLIAALPTVLALLIVSIEAFRWVPLPVVSIGSAAYFGFSSAMLLLSLEAAHERGSSSAPGSPP